MPSYLELAEGKKDISELMELLRDAVVRMAAHTGRPVIVYEGSMTVPSISAWVNVGDVDHLMDVCRGVSGRSIDVILNSGGGYPDGADQVVCYLRQKFDDVRVIVPRMAMSAATMIACCADRLVLGAHSFLGPVDMQFASPGRGATAAAELLQQFAMMRSDFGPKVKDFWDGPGTIFLPDLHARCVNGLALGRAVAERALKDGMFRTERDAGKAERVASLLADHEEHRAHGRPLSRAYLRQIGMVVDDLETDNDLQELALTIHHACRLIMESNPSIAKIVISSSLGLKFELVEPTPSAPEAPPGRSHEP
jgi:hypothetical protein